MFTEALAASSVAGIATAIASVITSIGVLVGGLAIFLPLLRKMNRDVVQVKHLVNQQLTDSKNYQQALIRALVASGIDVPIDQANPD